MVVQKLQYHFLTERPKRRKWLIRAQWKGRRKRKRRCTIEKLNRRVFVGYVLYHEGGLPSSLWHPNLSSDCLELQAFSSILVKARSIKYFVVGNSRSNGLGMSSSIYIPCLSLRTKKWEGESGMERLLCRMEISMDAMKWFLSAWVIRKAWAEKGPVGVIVKRWWHWWVIRSRRGRIEERLSCSWCVKGEINRWNSSIIVEGRSFWVQCCHGDYVDLLREGCKKKNKA